MFTLKGISLSSAELKELVSILGGWGTSVVGTPCRDCCRITPSRCIMMSLRRSSDKVPYQLLTDILASYRITDDVEEPTMTISGTERESLSLG